MNAEDFRTAAKQLVDFVADYLEGLRTRPVLPDVQPGYLNELVPEEPPTYGEPWMDLFNDIEPVVIRGMTHWHSPRFHAYFPTANSYPGICGDILSTALACIGFTWNAAPACTELEMRMMDWLGLMLGLPRHFLFQEGPGGGVVQTTASESTLIAMLGARTQILRRNGLDNHIGEEDAEPRFRMMSRMVAYASSQSHSSVEKAAMLSATRIRLMPVTGDLAMDPEALREQISKDRERGLIPTVVIATLGTTNTCAFDDLRQIGESEGIWLHVDAAYAGAAFVCPELRHYMDGIQYATSITINPHKWLLVNFDCNAFWVRDRSLVEEAFSVNPLYLKHENQDRSLDYRHWQIPLGRRFRSLKMWFVFRTYGVKGLQDHIRKQRELAQLFGQLLKTDDRFELFDRIRMGLVCFRLRGSNELNERLIGAINHDRKIFLTPAKVNGQFIIRFAICARTTNENDVMYSWSVIQRHTDQLPIDC